MPPMPVIRLQHLLGRQRGRDLQGSGEHRAGKDAEKDDSVSLYEEKWHPEDEAD